MSDVGNEILKNFPPAVQTTIRWVLLGVIIATGFFYMSNRVDAADAKATTAQAQIAVIQSKVDTIQAAVQDIRTAQAVAVVQQQSIKDAAMLADTKLDAILSKLSKP